MIRVGIETSSSLGSVAVARDGALLAEVALGTQRRHAEMALPALDFVLGAAGVERADIGEVVVGGGPGSFTGVRVAGATAKGLVAALDVPLRAFSSLLALAAGVAARQPVCALLDARREEVYAGCWLLADGETQERLAPTVGPLSDVLSRVPDAVFAGDGARRYRQVLERHGAAVAPAPAAPRASTLLWLAARDPEAGRVADASAWEPSYIRASSAERGVAG